MISSSAGTSGTCDALVRLQELIEVLGGQGLGQVLVKAAAYAPVHCLIQIFRPSLSGSGSDSGHRGHSSGHLVTEAHILRLAESLLLLEGGLSQVPLALVTQAAWHRQGP